MSSNESVTEWLEQVTRDACLTDEYVDINVLPQYDELGEKENHFLTSAFRKRGRSSIKRSWADSMADPSADVDSTPRPNKKRALAGPLAFPVHSDTTSESDLESHRSGGRLSPPKEMTVLEDLHRPIIFRDFECQDRKMPDDVEDLRERVQRLADGIGILAYTSPELAAVAASLNRREKSRFEYPWANDPPLRSKLGKMPELDEVIHLVHAATSCDQDRVHENVWNEDIHYLLLKLALRNSTHTQHLIPQVLKTAAIDPPSLSEAKLPRRVVDYGIGLSPDSQMLEKWDMLRALPDTSVRSWNHTTLPRLRKVPIAVSIETKAGDKSWTLGKSQVALWADALFNRLAELPLNLSSTTPALPAAVQPPAMPIVIAQGHDWHMLIISRWSPSGDRIRMTIWQKIDIGSTRNCFDAFKLIAVLQLLAEWAQVVWRPYFHSLIV